MSARSRTRRMPTCMRPSVQLPSVVDVMTDGRTGKTCNAAIFGRLHTDEVIYHFSKELKTGSRPIINIVNYIQVSNRPTSNNDSMSESEDMVLGSRERENTRCTITTKSQTGVFSGTGESPHFSQRDKYKLRCRPGYWPKGTCHRPEPDGSNGIRQLLHISAISFSCSLANRGIYSPNDQNADFSTLKQVASC